MSVFKAWFQKMKTIKPASYYIKKGKHFVLVEIWTVEHHIHPKWLRFFVRLIKIITIAARGFNEDRVMMRASALTFYSILSVVPVLAMAFGVAKGFGFDDYLRNQIITQFKGQEEVMQWLLNFANNMLDKSKTGLIAGVGIVILFWSVMKVLSNIESSLNDIWHVKKSRSWARKFSDYLSMMLLAPIFLMLSSSTTVYLTYAIADLSSSIALLGYVAPYIQVLIQLLPYVFIWLLFAMVYITMPATKVRLGSGVVAGILAGSVFHLVQWAYITFQVGMARYNAIYGSFAALPLFLVWMQTSWIVMLMGAELSFAYQNIEKIETDTESKQVSPVSHKLLSLLITHQAVLHFAKGLGPVKASELSGLLNVPFRLIIDTINDLTECGILSEVVSESTGENAYQPALDIHQISVSFVLNRLDNCPSTTLHLQHAPAYPQFESILADFNQHTQSLNSNQLLMDLPFMTS